MGAIDQPHPSSLTYEMKSQSSHYLSNHNASEAKELVLHSSLLLPELGKVSLGDYHLPQPLGKHGGLQKRFKVLVLLQHFLFTATSFNIQGQL